MIQIYSPGNTNYSKNGDMVIFPTSCYADSRLKGEWKLELSHPLDEEGRWKYIVENAVVSVPTSLGEGQLYRITYVEKTDTGVDAEAIPVFFDAANEIFLMDTCPTNKNGQEALNIMLSGHTDKYSATSDISRKSTAYFVRKNFIEALNNQDEDEAFVNRWGGEPIYTNYNLIMNERAGADNGVHILYGKNIESISETIDMGDVATRIVPVSSDGYTLEGDTPWVDSPLIGSYPIVFTKEYTYDSIRLKDDSSEEGSGQDGSAEDGEYPDLPSLRAALRATAEGEFANGADKPKVNLKIGMIDLTRTDMYKDYSVLETVHLGDTVHCKHNALGIVTDARVIDIRWDCIRNCVDSIEIGETQYDYFKAVNTAINSIPKVPEVFDENGNVMGRYISGIIDLARTRLAYQKNNAQRSDVRAILYEDTAETLSDGTPNPQYGALCIGTAGIQISHEKDIYGDWIWGTAIDFQSINAEHIIAGILADKTGTNYWNLNTGEFRLSMQAEVSDGITLDEFVKSTSGIDTINYKYGTSNSPSVVPTSWQDDAPSWRDGVYIWYKTTTTRYDETTGGYISEDTDPVCLTGNVGATGAKGDKGDTGATGKGIKSSVEQYYLSTSSSSQSGGSWGTTMPTWSTGHYIWTRLFITWSDNTTSYTTPVLAKAINSANENAKAAQDAVTTLDANLNQEAIFNRLTNNGAAQGIFMKDGQLYINMSYLKTGVLKLGGNNNQYGSLELYDENGKYTGYINCGGLSLGDAFFNSVMIYGEGQHVHLSLGETQIDGTWTAVIGGYGDEDTQPIYIRNLEGYQAVYDNVQSKDVQVYNDTWANVIMQRVARSDAAHKFSIWIEDAEIQRLSCKPWGTESGSSWYRPVGSYATNGNRVQYIASHSSTHSVKNSIGVSGQFGSTSGYSSKNFAPSTSDKRLKENIKDCDISALPFIDSIKMRQFDWKADGFHQECGFIADELEEMDENLAVGGGYNEDGTMNEKSVNDFYLLGYLTKAVQELSAKVKDLETKLEKFPG